jgi:hypothetical protein
MERRTREEASDVSCLWMFRFGYGGPEISPATMRPVAELDLPFGIDFHDADAQGALSDSLR